MIRTLPTLALALPLLLAAPVAHAEPSGLRSTTAEPFLVAIDVTQAHGKTRQVERYTLALTRLGRPGDLTVTSRSGARFFFNLHVVDRGAVPTLAFQVERWNADLPSWKEDRARCGATGEVTLGTPGEKRIGAHLACQNLEELEIAFTPLAQKK